MIYQHCRPHLFSFQNSITSNNNNAITHYFLAKYRENNLIQCLASGHPYLSWSWGTD